MEEIFYEILAGLLRHDPGDHDSTIKAFRSIPKLGAAVRILDVGCDTGNQTKEKSGVI